MSRYILAGVVRALDLSVSAGFLVRAYDRDLRNEQLLGESVTNEDGYYEIKYDPKQFARAEKKRADLIVRVYTRKGKKLLYEPSFDEILFNAPKEAEFNIQLKVSIPVECDEFTTLVRTTASLIENIALYELEENNDNQDISFLSRECNVESIKLDHLVLAHRMANKSRIAVEFFYALFRKDTLLKNDLSSVFTLRFQVDLNSDIESLLYEIALINEKQIVADIKLAVKEKIIPSIKKEDLKDSLTLLEKLKGKAKKHHAKAQSKKVIELISTFANKEKIQQISEVLKESKQDYRKFFELLSSTEVFESAKNREEAKASVEIAEIIGFDVIAVNSVKELADVQKPEELKKLVKSGHEGWKDLLSRSAEKIKETGIKINNKLIDLHARSLAKKTDLKFPTLAFAAKLKQEKKPKFETQDEIIGFFDKHDEFDLKKSNVDLFFRKKKISRSKNQKLLKDLKNIQRVYKLTPDYDKTTALIENKVHSAQSIIGFGRSRFINEIAPKAGIALKEAEDIFARSEAVHTASMMIVGELQDTMRSAEISASKIDSLSLKLKAVSEDFPNMKSLFKMTDLCACEQCRSVYSPAAYLVEVLQFLEKRSVVDLTTNPVTEGYLAKDVLFERRSDLGDLDLSCDNAMTPLPYIDLVCEILEDQIAPDAGIDYAGPITEGAIPANLLTLVNAKNIPFTNKAVIFEPDVNGDYILRDDKAVCKIINVAGNDWKVKRLRQTYASAAELAAAPEYINEAAYIELESSSYAFKLPFSLAHTEGSAYFERFDIKRSDLMREYQIAATPENFEIAAEKLGISDQERVLIVAPDVGNQNKFWNVNPADVVADMEIVDTFLTKSGLSYPELSEFLQLKYINPDELLFIRHLDETCDTAQKEIDSLDLDALDRMHRFLRLMKLSGWKKEILNEIVVQVNLGKSALNNNCLELMGQLLEINERTGIKLDELIGFYGTIPHVDLVDSNYQSLYQTIFLNKAVNGFIDEGLKIENIDVGDLISNHKTSVALCLQVTEEELDSLLVTLVNADLTYLNLSSLYASTLLSRRLKISVSDFLVYKELINIDIFFSPENTLQFIERFTLAKESALGVEDVKFLLFHEASNLVDREIKDDKITSILKALQTSYQAAYDSTRSPFNVDLMADELKEPLKNLLLQLPGMNEEIANNFMRMVDYDWTAPPNAADYIDEHLSATIENLVQIKAAQAALEAAPGPNLEDVEVERKGLIEALLTEISAYLYQAQKQNSLKTQISESFSVDIEVASAILDNAFVKQLVPANVLLKTHLSGDLLVDLVNIPANLPVVNEATFPKQFASLRLCHKLFLLSSSVGISSDNLAWLLSNSSTFVWFEMDSVPFQAGQIKAAYQNWEVFVKTLGLLNSLSAVVNPSDAENPITFGSIMDLLLPTDALPFTGSRDELLNTMAILNAYDRDLLDEIDLFFGFSNPDIGAYRNPETWRKISRVMEYPRKMGVPLAQINSYLKARLDVADTESLRMALKARYTESLWLTTLAEIMDNIRPQKHKNAMHWLLIC